MLPTNVLALYTSSIIFVAILTFAYIVLRRFIRSRGIVWAASLVCAILFVVAFHPTRPILEELSVGLEAADVKAGATPRPPATVDPAMYDGRAYDLRVPDEMPAGLLATGTVTVHNASAFRWPTRGEFSVKVGFRFYDQSGVVAGEGRASLFPDVASDETRTVVLTLRAPLKTGVYTLKVGPLFEAITWFDTAGGASVRKEVHVI
jgi:hypothetical protein